MSTDEYDLYERDEPALDGVERNVYDAVDVDAAWSLVERFADLDRTSGGEGERRAADYLCDRLDDFAVAYDRYEPELLISVPESASVRAVAPVEETFGNGTDRPAVKTVSFSESATVTGETVRVDREDPDLDRDLAGKVAVVEGRGLPDATRRRLETGDAAACVAIHPHDEEPHEDSVTPVWGAAPVEPWDRLPELPVATVSRSVGDRLLALHDAGGLELDVSTDVTTDWTVCPIVVARIPASDPVGDEVVLLHGHYDAWHEGVTDNATGDGVLLESARVFQSFRESLSRDLWVAWWPGHSQGRYAGSTWFADEFAHELDERCLVHVNVDSPGAKGATELTDMITWPPELDDVFRRTVADVCGKPTERHRPGRAGDYSFYNLGITGQNGPASNVPAAVRERRGYHRVGGSGLNADAYHLTTDTLEKADPDVLLRDVRVYAVLLARLLVPAVVPLDYRPTIERHREVVEEYADAVDAVDLGPVLEELDRLADGVEEFYRAVDREELDPAAANARIRRLSRGLVRADYATGGRFEQDPAVPRPPYPRIAPERAATAENGGIADGAHLDRWRLRRGRNAVLDDLRTARTAVADWTSVE